jgi:hypothetical protein
MNHWRYYFVSASTMSEGCFEHVAIFPSPHLVRMSFHPARKTSGPDAKDELELVFSTATVTVRGEGLAEFARSLEEQKDFQTGRLCEVAGGVGREVEINRL